MKKLLVSIGLIFLFLTGSTPVKAVEINKNDLVVATPQKIIDNRSF